MSQLLAQKLFSRKKKTENELLKDNDNNPNTSTVDNTADIAGAYVGDARHGVSMLILNF